MKNALKNAQRPRDLNSISFQQREKASKKFIENARMLERSRT